MMTDKYNLDEEIISFRKRIEVAHKDLSDFEKRHLNGLREQAVIFCLRRATDISQGCVLSAESHLPNSVTALTRALYETFIRCAWVVQSDENARIYNNAAVDIMQKDLVKNLRKGTAKINRKSTGKDATQEFLEIPDIKKALPRLPGWDEMAAQAGLEKVHTALYSFLSVYAHGTQFGLSNLENDKPIFSFICSANALLHACLVIARNWKFGRKLTTASEIMKIMGLSNFNSEPDFGHINL